MAPPPEPFELCIEGTHQPRQYLVYVPDGHGGRAAEHTLKIDEELGDRSGVSSSLHQLGRLAEDQGELSSAVSYIVRALAILEQLGSPNREIARRILSRLRDKMGQEAFVSALQAAGVQSAPPDKDANESDEKEEKNDHCRS